MGEGQKKVPSHPVDNLTTVEGERGIRMIVLKEPITTAKMLGNH